MVSIHASQNLVTITEEATKSEKDLAIYVRVTRIAQVRGGALSHCRRSLGALH